jgi:hypothetical protein
MSDQAPVRSVIFAYRHGFAPEGGEKSITELEYDRVVEAHIAAPTGAAV